MVLVDPFDEELREEILDELQTADPIPEPA